jgi:hypothetical protein
MRYTFSYTLLSVAHLCFAVVPVTTARHAIVTPEDMEDLKRPFKPLNTAKSMAKWVRAIDAFLHETQNIHAWLHVTLKEYWESQNKAAYARVLETYFASMRMLKPARTGKRIPPTSSFK